MINALNQDTKEVVAFPDSTSADEIQNFFNGEKYGSITTSPKAPLLDQIGEAVSGFVQEKAPSFYDTAFKPFYDKLGENLLRPNYLAPDEPGDWRRAFTTSLAESATMGIMKAPDREQLAKEHPIASTAGAFAGFAAPMGVINAGLKATKIPRLLKAGVDLLTPIATKYPKVARIINTAQKATMGAAQSGLSIGAYNVIAETTEELRTQDHLDLLKIGENVIKDTLPWMAAGAVSGVLAKPLEGLGLGGKVTQLSKEIAASSGSLYLIAKSNGASEKDALLQAGMGAIFHVVSVAGNYDAARDFEVKETRNLIKGYIKAENPMLPDAVVHRSAVEYTEQLMLEHKQETKDLGVMTKKNYERDYLKTLDKANELAKTLEPMRLMAKRTGRGLNEIAETEREAVRLLDEAEAIRRDYQEGLKKDRIKSSVELAMERADAIIAEKEGIGIEQPKDIKTYEMGQAIGEETKVATIGQETPKTGIVEPIITPKEGGVTPVVEPKVAEKKKNLQSRVYERLKEEHPNILTDDASREAIVLKEEAKKAVDLIEKDKQRAYEIAMNQDGDKDYLSASVNIALADQALAEGNNALFNKLTRARSFAQTRRGQEIVAEKGSIEDNSVAKYVKDLLAERMLKVGNDLSSPTQKAKQKISKKTSSKVAMEKIETDVKKVEKEFKKYSKELDIKEAQALIDSLVCK
jgi:hypothetical protein